MSFKKNFFNPHQPLKPLLRNRTLTYPPQPSASPSKTHYQAIYNTTLGRMKGKNEGVGERFLEPETAWMLHLRDANLRKAEQGKLPPIFCSFPLPLRFLAGCELCCIRVGTSQVGNPSNLNFKRDSFIWKAFWFIPGGVRPSVPQWNRLELRYSAPHTTWFYLLCFYTYYRYFRIFVYVTHQGHTQNSLLYGTQNNYLSCSPSIRAYFLFFFADIYRTFWQNVSSKPILSLDFSSIRQGRSWLFYTEPQSTSV